MKILKALLFIGLLLPRIIAAETIPGYDVLGMAMYCKQFLAAPKLPAFSFLMSTFGDAIPCANERLALGGVKVVQVDLIDATCWRNRVCPPGVPRPDDLKVIKQRAAIVRKLALKYTSTHFDLSPALEHDIKDENTVKKMAAAAKAGCPECSIINTPTTGSARPKGIPLELHGTNVRAYSVSSDGASQFDGDNLSSDCPSRDYQCSDQYFKAKKCKQCAPFEHRTSGTFTTYGWIPEFNLRCSGEKSFTAPKERTEKPSADLFRQSYMLMQPEPPKPAPPPICKEVRDIRPGVEITKPNAEHYCNGQNKDPRGNKPLLIVQIPGKRGQQMPVYKSSGQQVAAFCYWDTYSPMKNAHRWYIGDCTRETPAQLVDELGSEWGYALYDKNKCLRFNAIRRQGIYR